ncbi:MAG: efflux RND transporter periplasmic adaptor subunit [Chthoniobacteraceae bacterium]
MYRPRVAAIILLALAACSKPAREGGRRDKDATVSVTVVAARTEPWERKILLVGALLPNQEARIAAEVEGSIEKTLAEVGDAVKAGAELAQIDTASYQGMVNLQTANLAKAEASAENTAENLSRLERLRKTGSVSPTDYDQAAASNKQAQAEVNAAKASLGAASTSMRRSLARAPFDGAIAERLVNAGDFVRIGTVMFNVVDDSTLRFRGEVPEREAARIKVAQLVRLTVDAYPGRVFEGRVSWINPAVNVATRSVGIEARVDNSKRELKANFFARGELVVDDAAPTLVVPIDTILTFAGVNKVFVVEGDAASVREVELGLTRGDQQEILSGLKPGERVILNGRTKVQDGTKVKVQDA